MGKVARIVTGVLTGGWSEAARAVGKGLTPKVPQIPQPQPPEEAEGGTGSTPAEIAERTRREGRRRSRASTVLTRPHGLLDSSQGGGRFLLG